MEADFCNNAATGKPHAQGGRSDRSQRHPLPISEAPHETGDTVWNFERVHVRPVPVPLQFKHTSTGS